MSDAPANDMTEREAYLALPPAVRSHCDRFPTICNVRELARLYLAGEATEEMILAEFVDVRRSMLHIETNEPMRGPNRRTRRASPRYR